MIDHVADTQIRATVLVNYPERIRQLQAELARYERLERAAQKYLEWRDRLAHSGGTNFVDMPNPLHAAEKELRDALAALGENHADHTDHRLSL